MILWDGRCLDCPSEDVVMEGDVDSDEARYFATDDYEGEACDEFVDPRGGDDLFGFASMGGSSQCPIVLQVIRDWELLDVNSSCQLKAG